MLESLAKEEWSFEDEIETILNSPVEDLAVSKDLHRLASRIDIKCANQRNDQIDVQNFEKMKEISFQIWYLLQGIKADKEYCAIKWPQFSNQGTIHITKVGEDNALRIKIFDNKNPNEILLEYMTSDKNYNIVNTKDSSRYFTFVPEKIDVLFCENCEDEVTYSDEYCESCKANYCHLCSKVLHRNKQKREHKRLRISPIGIAFSDRKISAEFSQIIKTKRRESVNLSTVEQQHEEGHLKDSEKKLIYVVKELTKALEEEAVYKNVLKFLYDNFYNAPNPEKARDVPYLTEKLIYEVLPKDSPTVRIFKCIHQGIIAQAKRKLLVSTRLPVMVKDYKGREGWAILVDIQPNTIQVIHRRREETLPVAPKTEQFYFDYEIVFTFSKLAEVLYAVNIKIFNLKYIEPVNEQFRNKIDKILGKGSLIIS